MNARGNFIRINKWLLPLSWLYGIGVKLRNMAFEMNLLKSRSFDIPVISVGNITVGGTGKTPHVEYLIELLKDHCKVAVLSRGYKRKSKGFVLADNDTPMKRIGDEPFQMKRKYPDITVAVDKKRCHGIDQLTELNKADVILLDDAFQHRYVQPGINILLVDYHRLIIDDCLLPAGRLREPLSAKDRADVVIVTKCPKDMKPMEYRVTNKMMQLYAYQSLYFTSLKYGPLRPMFGGQDKQNQGKRPLESIKADEHILLLTGIASPKQMIQDLKPYTTHLTPLTYSDHHQFKSKDIQHINNTFEQLPKPRLLITTEKDAARLYDVEGLSDEVKNNMYILPVTISFMLDQGEMFNKYIISYVRKNSRNSILDQRKDDHKSHNSDHSGNRTRTISFRNN